MRTIWVGISLGREGARILAKAGAEETLLKARFSSEMKHPRALATLLEALAMWQGESVRAALAVEHPHDGSDTSLCRDWFGADAVTPLYTLDIVPAHQRIRRRDRLSGVGDFRDLEQLIIREVAR